MILFLGALLLFIYWLLFVILRVSSTERPTFSGAAMEEDAYIIYSVNQWTGVENSVIVPYDTLVQVLIGVWTNPSFKGIHSDYPGAKCISLYTDDDGLPAYSTSFTHDEAILELWVSRLRKNNVPMYVTGRNITMATTAHYEELFRTIKAVPYDGTRMIREFFEEQEDLSFWWPTNKGLKIKMDAPVEGQSIFYQTIEGSAFKGVRSTSNPKSSSIWRSRSLSCPEVVK